MAKVYIRTNENNEIEEVASSIFLEDPTGWIEIDEGVGDMYAHAQNNYLDGPTHDEQGNPRYKYVGGKIKKIPPPDPE